MPGEIMTIEYPSRRSSLPETGRGWAASAAGVAILVLIFAPPLLAEQPPGLVPLGSDWSYRPAGESGGDAEAETTWFEPDFREPWKVWRSGSDLALSPGTTRVGGAGGRRQELQLRHTFELSEAQLTRIRGLGLRLTRGDGVTVYLNGAEVYRLGSPYDESDASPSHGVRAKKDYLYRWHFGPELLTTGTNVVAVESFHRSAQGDGAYFDLELLAVSRDAVVWRGPYLQRGTPHSATLHFATDVPTEPVLRYGRRLEQLEHRQAGPLGLEHVLLVEGLEPDTTYYYAVELGGRWLVGPSREQRFHTHPPANSEKPVRIWAIGDSGQGQFGGAEIVRDSYLSYSAGGETDVWLMLGDNAYNDGRMEEYQDALFDVYPAVLRNTFLWPAIGNHDGRAFRGPKRAPYLDLFDLPARGESGGVPSNVELFYSFDYGNVHFVVLDSEIASLEPGDPQIKWLRRDLEKNRAEWTIAVVHIAPYTKGSHDSDGPRRHFIVRENVVPILEEHGVDLLLSGHSHAYERSHLIRGHYGDSKSWDPEAHIVDAGNDGAYLGRGTIYAVVGSSSYLSLKGRLDHPAMARVVRALGSMVIDVEGDRLEARFLQADGKIGDRFVIRHERAGARGSGAPGAE